jgi:nitroreductase
MTTVFETIQHRRSVGKVDERQPTREQITKILEAATHAPNHHKVEPWRFFVLADKARQELGEIMAASLAKRLADTTSEKAQAMLEKERNKPLRAPVILIAVAEHPTQPNVLEIENIMAVAAAVQNMLLTAEELGLACMWRTGDAAYDPKVKQWLNIEPEDHIVAFIYLGYPAIALQDSHPQPVENKTSWLGWTE